MPKTTIIYYYSRTGSNKYLAEKTAKSLNCDIEEIKPRLSAFPVLLLATLLPINPRIKTLKNNPKDYDKIILCGPIWMGQLISPLRSFIKKYKESIKELYFITCCGSSDEKKNDTFGHGHVFAKVKKIVGNKLKQCEAFPILLFVPENKVDDGKFVMNTRLSNENFKGEIAERLNKFIDNFKA